MAFQLTYGDYVASHPADATGGSEGGEGTSSLMSEEAWNNLSDAQKWHDVGGGIALSAEDPRYAELAKMVGSTSGSPIFAMYGSDPKARSNDQFVDPSRVVDQGSVMFVANDNLTPKAQSDTSGLSGLGWVLAALAVVGGGAFAGAAMDGAAAGAAGDTVDSAITASQAGSASQGAGIYDTAAGAEGAGANVADALTPPAVDAPPPVETPPAGPPEAGTSPPVDTPPPPATSPGTTDPTLPPGTQSPAPTTDLSTPPPATQPPGLVDRAMGAYNNTVNAVTPQWYQNLSPAARTILGQGLSTAGKGVFGYVNQREANQAAVEAEQRHRNDVIRRGQVSVLPPHTFTPKPGGIINNTGGTGP